MQAPLRVIARLVSLGIARCERSIVALRPLHQTPSPSGFVHQSSICLSAFSLQACKTDFQRPS
jgi:hypothetical protein